VKPIKVPEKETSDMTFHVPCHPYVKLHSDIKHPKPGAHVAQSAWTMPNLCARYKWPTGLAGGGVIAIVELGGGYTLSDMSAYFKGIGQPLPNITDVSVDGTKNTPGGDADDEVALDIQVAAAGYYVATGKPATIRVYWAQDIAPAVRAATKDGCDVCSISWGADEAEWGAAAGADMEAAALAAVNAGMVVFAASGDNDSSDGGSTPANVDLPASAPHVVGCGGTSLTATSEVVWNNDPGQASGEGTGGGYSTLFPAQSFQKGIPPAPSGLGRMVPDVASDADPNTGIQIFVGGQSQIVGGTSAAAPLWAGLVAACGTKLGFITPKFYTTAGAFTDIVSGENGAYDAGPGPDPCTGMGSPDGMVIAMLLGSTTPPAPPTTKPPVTTPAPPTTRPPTTTPAPTTTRPPHPTTTPAPTTTRPPQTTPPPDHHHHHHHGGRDDGDGGNEKGGREPFPERDPKRGR
jgi:kumamolisin